MDFTYALWVSSILFWILSMMLDVNALTHDRPPPLMKSKNSRLKNPSDSSTSYKTKKSSSLSSSSSSTSTSSKSSPRKCCQNSGICVMGVFCHCPKNFYGFRCEHEMRSCGPIEHKAWARVGCNLCRCYDSKLLCLPHVYQGCDHLPAKKNVNVSDYDSDDIHVFPPDETTIDPFYADYYDDQYYSDDTDYHDDTSSSSSKNNSSSSTSIKSHFPTKILLLVLSLSLYLNHFRFLKFYFR